MSVLAPKDTEIVGNDSKLSRTSASELRAVGLRLVLAKYSFLDRDVDRGVSRSLSDAGKSVKRAVKALQGSEVERNLVSPYCDFVEKKLACPLDSLYHLATKKADTRDKQVYAMREAAQALGKLAELNRVKFPLESDELMLASNSVTCAADELENVRAVVVYSSLILQCSILNALVCIASTILAWNSSEMCLFVIEYCKDLAILVMCPLVLAEGALWYFRPLSDRIARHGYLRLLSSYSWALLFSAPICFVAEAVVIPVAVRIFASCLGVSLAFVYMHLSLNNLCYQRIF